MIQAQLLRELTIRLPEGVTTHLSAASALVRVDAGLYVVADDQTFLARFAADGNAPGEVIALLDEQWPDKPKARKKAKADLESLVHLPVSRYFPGGALFALGSGSRENRERGILLPLMGDGNCAAPTIIDLGDLFDPLKPHFPKLNIEAAFVDEEEFVLLQRGNKADSRNACVRFALGDVLDAIAGKRPFAGISAQLHFYSLGDIDNVPLCFTDAAALPGGRFVFSAVAENVSDNYNDGQCLGAALGIADLDGNVLHIDALDRPHKVEGIEAQIADGHIKVLLVTDADAPEIPARLLQAQMPNPA